MKQLTEVYSYLKAVLDKSDTDCYIIENNPITFVRVVFHDLINRETLIIVADICAHYELNYHVQLTIDNNLSIVITL